MLEAEIRLLEQKAREAAEAERPIADDEIINSQTSSASSKRKSAAIALKAIIKSEPDKPTAGKR